jgi:hypothetical protein
MHMCVAMRRCVKHTGGAIHKALDCSDGVIQVSAFGSACHVHPSVAYVHERVRVCHTLILAALSHLCMLCTRCVLQVLDARNVPGTRCEHLERHLAKNAPHKHLVFVINKVHTDTYVCVVQIHY